MIRVNDDMFGAKGVGREKGERGNYVICKKSLSRYVDVFFISNTPFFFLERKEVGHTARNNTDERLTYYVSYDASLDS